MKMRWRKVWRDVVAERGRIAMMTAAIAVSLVAVGTVLGAAAVLTREIDVNYQSTSPADATIELDADVDDAVLSVARCAGGGRG